MLLLALAAACTQSAQSAERGAPGTKTKGKRPERPPVPVATTPARLGSIASHYATTATLDAEKTASVLARVEGVVKSLHAEEGDLVNKGAVLLRIDNDEYELRAAQARAKTAGLQDRYDRAVKVVKKGLVAVEEMKNLEHDLAAAKAEQGLAELSAARTVVRAPFTGRVTRRAVDVGATVRDGAELFSLADLQPLLARVHVPSKTFGQLKRDQTVELVLDSDGAQLEGKITLVSPVIDANTGTIKVTLEVATYPEGTRPGDFATVRVVTERHDDVLLVPRNAVIDDRDERVVYIAKEDRAERRVVEVGLETDDSAEITKGLEAGEAVVTKGQHSLKDKARLKVVAKGD